MVGCQDKVAELSVKLHASEAGRTTAEEKAAKLRQERKTLKRGLLEMKAKETQALQRLSEQEAREGAAREEFAGRDAVGFA